MIRNTAEYLQQEYYLAQQELNFFPAKMQKKFYTNCTAAVLRAKDCVMKTVSKVQENAEDIYAEDSRSTKTVQQLRKYLKILLRKSPLKKQRKLQQKRNK